MTRKAIACQRRNGTANKLSAADRPGHDWYRFVLSFPPHLVREYLARFGVRPDQRVLDPFCGTGTTLVECKKLGLESVGLEPLPMAHFASCVKTDWTPDPHALLRHAQAIGEATLRRLEAQGIRDNAALLTPPPREVSLRSLLPAQMKLLLENSISPLPLHKALVLLECMESNSAPAFAPHERLALAKALVTTIGNLHFGPEVGVGTIKTDVPVVSSWLSCVRRMAKDIERLREMSATSTTVHRADARQIAGVVGPCTIDAVITSPPYPNEKDYTRTTRLESVLLGFVGDVKELRAVKKTLLRSNTRGVYKDDSDDQWVRGHPKIENIANHIEQRRKEMGKTSGFEKMYARVTRLYFGGMARHLAELRSVLRPGARLAYVVGDQASYLRVMIRTGCLLAEIAQSLGYEVAGVDLFRTRWATATQEELREEVVLFRWPG